MNIMYNLLIMSEKIYKYLKAKLSTSGIKAKPISIATAITMMLATVPSPGICFSGIQSAKTVKDMKKVGKEIGVSFRLKI